MLECECCYALDVLFGGMAIFRFSESSLSVMGMECVQVEALICYTKNATLVKLQHASSSCPWFTSSTGHMELLAAADFSTSSINCEHASANDTFTLHTCPWLSQTVRMLSHSHTLPSTPQHDDSREFCKSDGPHCLSLGRVL
jgi:hypothetical protein